MVLDKEICMISQPPFTYLRGSTIHLGILLTKFPHSITMANRVTRTNMVEKEWFWNLLHDKK